MNARTDFLAIPCPNCTDGIATTNDPSTARRCPECDGEGALSICCEICGEYGATEWFQSKAFHADCAAEVKADAFWVGEDEPDLSAELERAELARDEAMCGERVR